MPIFLRKKRGGRGEGERKGRGEEGKGGEGKGGEEWAAGSWYENSISSPSPYSPTHHKLLKFKLYTSISISWTQILEVIQRCANTKMKARCQRTEKQIQESALGQEGKVEQGRVGR